MKQIHLSLLTTILLCFHLSAFSADPAVEKIRSGNFSEAMTMLQENIKNNPDDWKARILLIDVLEILGDKRLLKEQQNYLMSMYRQGKITTAPAFTALAQAVRVENPKTAVKFFDEAHKADDKYVDAYVRAGFLYNDRFAWAKAKSEFEKAVELEPKNPDAMTGLALLAVNDSDYVYAKELVDKILMENPVDGEAVALNAGINLVEKKYDECRQQIDKVLAVNPKDIHVLSILAACHDAKGEEKQRDEVLSKIKEVNPSDAEAYLVMSDFASKRYDFNGALKWAKKASEVDRGDWTGNYMAGMALIRLGEEKEGYEQLDLSFKKNPYNICAFNILQAMDKDFKRNEYVLRETEHFAVKLPKGDDEVVWPYLKDCLEESYARLTAKYSFKPEGAKQYNGKILILFLATHLDFSVRTVGLPYLPAAGVCFGKVILLPSPRFYQNSPTGEFCWRAVVDHEFMHVISLQMTDFRIPRWYTEGLSSMEEKEGHFNNKVLFSMARRGNYTLALDNMELGFIGGGRLIALHYYQAELICGCIEKKYGFKKLVEMLELYKTGMSTKHVLEKVTGKTFKDFGAELGEYYTEMNDDFESYLKTSGLADRESSDDDGEKDEFSPKEGKMKRPVPAWKVKVDILLGENRTDDAITFLENYIRYDNSTFEVYKLLGGLYAEKGKTDEALRNYESGFMINPFDTDTHLSAARLYKKAGNAEKAAREYRILKVLDKNNAEAEEYLKGKAN